MENEKNELKEKWMEIIQSYDKHIQPMNVLLGRIFEWTLMDYRDWKNIAPDVDLDFNVVFSKLCELVEKSLENGPLIKKPEDRYIR